MEPSRLFRPLSLGNFHLKNRIALAPLTRGRVGADLIAIGRPFITNPDLPERFQNHWPLNPAEDMSRWYTPGAEGYTDYAPYNPSASG